MPSKNHVIYFGILLAFCSHACSNKLPQLSFDCQNQFPEIDFLNIVDRPNNYVSLVPKNWELGSRGAYKVAAYDTINNEGGSSHRWIYIGNEYLSESLNFEKYIFQLDSVLETLSDQRRISPLDYYQIEDRRICHFTIEQDSISESKGRSIQTHFVINQMDVVNHENRMFSVVMGTRDGDMEKMICQYLDIVKSTKVMN